MMLSNTMLRGSQSGRILNEFGAKGRGRCVCEDGHDRHDSHCGGGRRARETVSVLGFANGLVARTWCRRARLHVGAELLGCLVGHELVGLVGVHDDFPPGFFRPV